MDTTSNVPPTSSTEVTANHKTVKPQSKAKFAKNASWKNSKPKASKKAPKTKRLGKAAIKAANPSGKCLCGCGEEVPRRFMQGHDAQLHSKVLEAFKEEKTVRVSKATAAYLKTAPWMDSKLAKVVRS